MGMIEFALEWLDEKIKIVDLFLWLEIQNWFMSGFLEINWFFTIHKLIRFPNN